MAWFVLPKKALKGLSKKQRKKKLQKLKNRWLAIVFAGVRVQRKKARAAREQQEKQALTLGRASKLAARDPRQRKKTRDRSDPSIKRSSKDEQLWKVKRDAMKERSRKRKGEAMDRWKMATEGGAFIGR